MNNLFGTDGIRNRVGNYPFTVDALHQLGKAIANWALNQYGSKVKLLLAHDTRISCYAVKSMLESGLLMYPIEIHDAGILPTPAVFHIMNQLNIQGNNYDAAIVISASHNEYHDNGIKIIDAKTGKLNYSDEIAICELMNSKLESNYNNLGISKIIANAKEIYIQKILSYFEANFLQNKKIVLDLANGATYEVAEEIFKKLGAEVISINNTPNGININKNCGALYLNQLQQAVIENSAHIGFAFDGDGDRVIAVNSKGEIKNGDDLIAILSTHPQYSKCKKIVGTVMTNQGLEVFLKKQDKELIRTSVGDKYILEKLNLNNLILGGEQSGHIILNNLINTGDGILVALKTLETIIYTNNWLAETFTKYPQVLLNVPIKIKKDLNLSPFSDLILQTQNRLNNGRLLVRYSGTEPLLRIMIEEESESNANILANELAQIMQKSLI